MEHAPGVKEYQVSFADAPRAYIRHEAVRTYDAPAPTLVNHLLGCVLVAQHHTTRVHCHLLVERCHRNCEIEKMRHIRNS